MAVRRTVFVCRDCGFAAPKWAGRCPDCGAWDSFDESTRPEGARRLLEPGGAAPIVLGDVDASDYPRRQFGMAEVERVLGGGLVPGSLVLLGGDPGIGKSTLMIQAASGLLAKGPVLYVSGEESPHQLKMRADRLGINGATILVLPEVALGAVVARAAEVKPSLILIDSIQTMQDEEGSSAPGSIAQVRDCAAKLLRYAKEARVPVLIAGHVTKDGAIAGPRTLEHLVDVVLYLEGDPHSSYRILRSVKNRFGPTNEVAVLAMHENGLTEVENPSAVFLSERREAAPGSAVAVPMEGTRAMLVEVQALVSRTVYSLPKRLANGYDPNRLTLMVAILGRRASIPLYDQDIYVNVVGGLRLEEPAVDLPVGLAIVSSFRDRPVRAGLAAFGEVGLAGEVRSVSQSDRRLAEARRMQFQTCLVPRGADRVAGNGALAVSDLAEALEAAIA